ncbi:MAG: indole-3-glycerol phosphate synthase TrpC [Myxococcota bacterium]
MARRYEAAGAACISVLTEPERFGGSFADLMAVSRAVAIPTLCKDFVVDPRQVLMARAHGASLVLLIVAALADAELVALRRDIEALGMQALVEAHDRGEVERALASGARIVGVNSRSLHTLVIDLAVAESLRAAIPDGVVAIAESGIGSAADVLRLRRAGYRRFLVGTSLMTAPGGPDALLRELVAAGHEGGS